MLSTKVGRLILDEVEDPAARELGDKGGLFEHGRPNRIVNDYSSDATLRSIEDSLKRLRTDRLEIVWVHDIAQDFYGDAWLSHFEQARTGAFRVLDRLRDEGVIKAWGLGVNRVEPCELTLELEGARPDGFLLARRYTLLDRWWAARISNTSRPRPRSWPGWRGSRPWPSAMGCRSRRPGCSSRWPIRRSRR